jgi:hypothetical protein
MLTPTTQDGLCEATAGSSLVARRRSAPPSRFANPFATCWIRPGAIPFRFPAGESAETLLAKLAGQKWRGAIVGPHGSGKSTLLETVKPLLGEVGFEVIAMTLQSGERRLPARLIRCRKRAVIVVDGYEQLGWLERMMLLVECGRFGHGLLVTSHAPTALPTLLYTEPSERLIYKLVEQLSAQVSTSITSSDVAASLACHGSNVREIFFDLYDRHEQLRRGE